MDLRKRQQLRNQQQSYKNDIMQKNWYRKIRNASFFSWIQSLSVWVNKVEKRMNDQTQQ
jgi:hypothetical protein